ncbi:hypothetical protein [Rufibacter roseus]|uniref:Uncharacterized protein n=1 Tax=Rufibacter roseus TaxID=1567108 RepID=A0ABW2DNW0_9BACT|nr:hypothetical protein [Rufibacter roseus]
MYQNTTPVIAATAGTITHNRWTISPEKENELDEYLAQLKRDAIEYMVNHPITPSNLYEVEGRIQKEARDVQRALDSGHAYKMTFELHDLVVKSACLKINSKHLMTIER